MKSLNNSYILNRNKIWDSNNEMKLKYNSKAKTENWRKWLEEEGVGTKDMDNSSDSQSLSYESDNQSIYTGDDSEYPDHIKPHVTEVKKLVDAYLIVLKKKFKSVIIYYTFYSDYCIIN